MDARHINSRVPEVVARYALFDEIARGGMARVHIGRLMGQAGFARTVAVKRLHSHLAHDAEFAAMFIDEALLAARIRHPNVVATVDVVTGLDELLLVMEFVPGVSLSWLFNAAKQRGERIPLQVAITIAIGALEGLHAAHEATTEQGDPLGIVHRDVSPQNIMIGVDGVPRVVDFGIAKASIQSRKATEHGQIKGKLRYMSPEQLRSSKVDRRTDVFALGVVLWELLTHERLFASDAGQVLERISGLRVDLPSQRISGLPDGVDEIIMRALEHEPERRFTTARDMAHALERVAPFATQREIGAWVEHMGAAEIGRVRGLVHNVESASIAGELARVDDESQSHILGAAATLGGREPSGTPVPPTLEMSESRRRGAATVEKTFDSTLTPPKRSLSGSASVDRWRGGVAIVAAIGLFFIVLALMAIGIGMVFAAFQPTSLSVPKSSSDPVLAPLTTTAKRDSNGSLPGSWKVESALAADSKRSYSGNVTIATRHDGAYTLRWDLGTTDTLVGTALDTEKLLLVGASANSVHGLVYYDVHGGKLTGRWVVSGRPGIGTESLEGPAGLNGSYRITKGTLPDHGADYSGNVTIKPRRSEPPLVTYDVEWQLDTGTHDVYQGVGIAKGDVLAVAWGSDNVVVLAYAKEGERLVGHYAKKQGGIGTETLRRP